MGRIADFFKKDLTLDVGVILNGKKETGTGNIIRATLAVVIPAILGMAGSTLQYFSDPEIGIIPTLTTFTVPFLLGLAEMLRQFSLVDKKWQERDRDRQKLREHLTN